MVSSNWRIKGFFLFIIGLVQILWAEVSGYLPSITSRNFRFDSAGVCFHPCLFVEVDSGKSFGLKNVLGDGDCVFRTVRLLSNNSTVVSRHQVAMALVRNTTFYITTAKNTVSGHGLLRKAAFDLNVTVSTYLEWLQRPGREGGLYAGGPELTVLSNLLKRCIRVYEPVRLDEVPDVYPDELLIECKGAFGTVFLTDSSQEPINILITDADNVKHACPLLPKSG